MQKKRVNLMKFLEGIFAQILMTATDLTWPSQLDAEMVEGEKEDGTRNGPVQNCASSAIFSVDAGHVGPGQMST